MKKIRNIRILDLWHNLLDAGDNPLEHPTTAELISTLFNTQININSTLSQTYVWLSDVHKALY